MAKQKIDGVIEAVHYAPDGQVAWVRAYERRGAIYSDHILITRQQLLDKLKDGKYFIAGRRKAYFGGLFELSQPLRIVPQNGYELLVVGDAPAGQDHLEGVPVI